MMTHPVSSIDTNDSPMQGGLLGNILDLPLDKEDNSKVVNDNRLTVDFPQMSPTKKNRVSKEVGEQNLDSPHPKKRTGSGSARLLENIQIQVPTLKEHQKSRSPLTKR